MPTPDFTIIHVVYTLVPGAFAGGVSKMVYELACAQKAQGLDVTVWTVGPYARTIFSGGVAIRSFVGTKYLGVVASAELNAALAARARARGPRLVVHAHNTFHPLNRHVRQALRGTRAGLFFSTHGALDPILMRGIGPKAFKKRAYIALIERPVLNAATGVFALTTNERDQLDAFALSAPIHIVPNGIARTNPLKRATRPDNRMSLGFIGRINPKKGLHHLLEALHILRRTHTNVTLTIAGDRAQFPAYVARLDAQVARLGLGDYVRWPGFLNEAAKRQMLAATDVFLHASESEGMPMAILEAMEAGVACVITPGCYMSEAVAAGAVVQVQSNPASLAAVLVELNAEPDRRTELARAGQNHARANHAWPVIAERYRQIYKNTQHSK